MFSVPLAQFPRTMRHNKSFKPLAMLARTLGTPHLIAHGFAIVAQKVLRTDRRLTGR